MSAATAAGTIWPISPPTEKTTQVIDVITRIAHLLKEEILGVYTTCGARVTAEFLLAIFRNINLIAKEKKLTAADRAMKQSYQVHCGGHFIYIPCGELDQVNVRYRDSPAFSSVREIFCRRVYLRGFKNLPRIRFAFDLGANRGMTTVMLARVLQAEAVVGIEPTSSYRACFSVLAKANQLTEQQCWRVDAFAGSTDCARARRVSGVANEFGIGRIDFLKCDIEGAEEKVFMEDDGLLGITERIAMELHPRFDVNNEALIERICAHGFCVSVADARGVPTSAKDADYLYASRCENELALPLLLSGSSASII